MADVHTAYWQDRANFLKDLLEETWESSYEAGEIQALIDELLEVPREETMHPFAASGWISALNVLRGNIERRMG